MRSIMQLTMSPQGLDILLSCNPNSSFNPQDGFIRWQEVWGSETSKLSHGRLRVHSPQSRRRTSFSLALISALHQQTHALLCRASYVTERTERHAKGTTNAIDKLSDRLEVGHYGRCVKHLQCCSLPNDQGKVRT